MVICSKEDEDKSHIISRLHTFRRPVVPRLDEGACREYLKAHFTLPTDMDVSSQAPPTQCAAPTVDPDKLVALRIRSDCPGLVYCMHVAVTSPVFSPHTHSSCVRVVSSTRSGMGKSLYIKRRAQQLVRLASNHDVHVTIPIHGPVATGDTLLEFFDQHTKRDACTIYHLDIAPRVSFPNGITGLYLIVLGSTFS